MKPGEFRWLPVRTVCAEPPWPYVRVLRDHHWASNIEMEVCFFVSDGQFYPQANLNQSIAARSTEDIPSAVGTLLLPYGFAPMYLEDYR